MGGKLNIEEEEAFNQKLDNDIANGAFQGAIDSNSSYVIRTLDENIERFRNLHYHIKWTYLNGLSVEQVLSISRDQDKARVYNYLYDNHTSDSEFDVDTAYNAAMNIKNTWQSLAFCTGKIDIDAAINLCPDGGEVSQVRGRVLELVGLDDTYKFTRLSQYAMLEIIKGDKRELEDSEISSEDINTALRFDRDHNKSAWQLIVREYANPKYGTEEYKELLAIAIKYDHDSQLALLEFMLANARISGAFNLPSLNDGQEYSHEALDSIKMKKKEIIDMADDMNPEHPILAALINKQLNAEIEELQMKSNINSGILRRELVNREVVVVDSVNALPREVFTFSDDEVQVKKLDIYRSLMRDINKEVLSGKDLAVVLKKIEFREGLVGNDSGYEEEKNAGEVPVSYIQEDDLDLLPEYIVDGSSEIVEPVCPLKIEEEKGVREEEHSSDEVFGSPPETSMSSDSVVIVSPYDKSDYVGLSGSGLQELETGPLNSFLFE